VAQPDIDSTRTSSSGSEPLRLDCIPQFGLRIDGSYQAHFACMQTQRHIRSFVLRAGRMTAAQERALTELWPSFGLEPSDALLDLEAVFGRRAPRCLEIGFGVGEVIGSLAENHPHIDYVGIEVHRPGVGRLLLRAQQANLRNLRVICHDAVEVLKHSVPNDSFDEILVFFPDPWHKKRHHKRRLIDAAFVASLADKLRAGGVLRLATDWQAYAEQMLAVCNANPQLASLSADGTYVARPDFRAPTRFERRGARLGHGVWDLAYARRAAPVFAPRSEEAAANPVDDELHGEGGQNHAG
jgi:tRNA (guanine-N7-)-methyltransferase